jgi:sec-independent protein translocase protein TatC
MTDNQTHHQPLIEHLIELRDRLLRVIYCLAISFGILFMFQTDIYAIVAKPLLNVLPEGAGMIATDVASPFFTPMRLTFFVSILITIPYFLYQTWAFIAPGLYQKEKRFAFPLLSSSVLLFFTGMAFAYFVVFPLIFRFMAGIQLEGVTTQTDISKYLDFVLHMFLAFGFIFEIPIATLLMIRSGIVTVEGLSQKRPYIIVACFVIGMLLTPPDIMSQFLLAIPMWLLFEIGLLLGRWIKPEEVEGELEENQD